MRRANESEINEFQKNYCCSEKNRNKIKDNFNIKIESFEQLIPGQKIQSYATGQREIEGSFIIFQVVNGVNQISYYPVFSETVGRKLSKACDLSLPSKMSIFKSSSKGKSTSKNTDRPKTNRKPDNKQMLSLICFSRAMMILHASTPKPMHGPFKDIYDKLYNNPSYDVFESDIKSINSAIRNFMSSSTNKKHENFTNLQNFIKYLQHQNFKQKLIDPDFSMLREKFHKKYPNEIIVF